jgi:phage-related protein
LREGEGTSGFRTSWLSYYMSMFNLILGKILNARSILVKWQKGHLSFVKRTLVSVKGIFVV